MSELRGILLRETDKARLFSIAGREVWIPRSVIRTITKLMPDSQGHWECILEVDDWFLDKNEL